jgi:hypothetical protein
MAQAGDYGEFSLRYPVYAVLSAEPDGEEGLVVVEVEGKDCLLLYRTRELAELYLEAAQADSATALTLRECRGDEELEHVVAQLPASVAHVIWDVTPATRALRMTAVADLLAVLRDEPEGGPGE